MPKLTQRAVDAIAPTGKQFTIWDSELAGFDVRVNAGGSKAFIAYYRVSGRQRLVTLGKHGKMKAEQARRLAFRHISNAVEGIDTASEEKKARKGQTVAQLGDRFLKEYVPVHLKPSTQAEYGRAVKLFIKPKIGSRKVADLDRSAVADFHHKLRDIPYQANRALGVLSKMMSQAEVWGLREEGSNPCLRVKKYKEEKRERFLSADELTALSDALDAEEADAPSAVAAYRLLILTGCRLGEIQSLKWDFVDLKDKVLRLPDSKTGEKTVYLGEDAIAVLKAIERIEGNPYVITGKKDGEYLTDLQKPWRRIRKRAGLEDIRIHDLRHTFASYGVGLGQSLPILGKLLGHTQAQTTARYAHLADDPVRAANAMVSTAIGDVLFGRKSQAKAASENKDALESDRQQPAA